MRPVNKPKPPTLEADAKPSPTPTPKDALTTLRMDLQDTIGYYCSFCEMPITVTQAVASKYSRVPKRMPTQAQWSELLLACEFCQVHRAADATDLGKYLWPDTDSTFTLGQDSPFLYALKNVNYVVKGRHPETAEEAASTRPMVIVAANFNSADGERAQRTIDLFRLNTPFYDAATNTFTITHDALQWRIDPRVELRTAVWEMASSTIETLRDAKTMTRYPAYFDGVGKLGTGLAQMSGFWSVWMTRLWDAFPDPKFIRQTLLETSTREGYQVIGSQTEPNGGSPPWTLFTGTAVTRVTSG